MQHNQSNVLRLTKGFLLRALALVVRSGCPTQTHPDPLISIGRFLIMERSDKIEEFESISDIH